MATCSPQALLAASRCFTCLDSKRLLEVMCSILCEILKIKKPMASCDIQSLMQSGACFNCLDDHQLLIVIAQFLCELLQSGGVSGAQILCGTVDPVNPPTAPCAIYYRADNGWVWYWNSIGAAWVSVIAG